MGDLITIGADGSDQVLLGSSRARAFDWRLPQVSCAGGAQPANSGELIIGTDEEDTLEGTPGDDVICGLDGNDDFYGFGGNDIIDAGPGDDWLVAGGDGDDVIRGGPGKYLMWARIRE